MFRALSCVQRHRFLQLGARRPVPVCVCVAAPEKQQQQTNKQTHSSFATSVTGSSAPRFLCAGALDTKALTSGVL